MIDETPAGTVRLAGGPLEGSVIVPALVTELVFPRGHIVYRYQRTGPTCFRYVDQETTPWGPGRSDVGVN